MFPIPQKIQFVIYLLNGIFPKALKPLSKHLENIGKIIWCFLLSILLRGYWFKDNLKNFSHAKCVITFLYRGLVFPCMKYESFWNDFLPPTPHNFLWMSNLEVFCPTLPNPTAVSLSLYTCNNGHYFADLCHRPPPPPPSCVTKLSHSHSFSIQLYILLFNLILFALTIYPLFY